MYQYQDGSVRWRKHNGKGDIRAYRVPKGWCARADLIEHHPIIGAHLGQSEWWIREVRETRVI